jgi:hypothetical protein
MKASLRALLTALAVAVVAAALLAPIASASGSTTGAATNGMTDGGSWNPKHMRGTGYGAAWMINHPAGFGQWLAMRGRQMNAMNTWWQQNNSAPGSRAAQAALKALNAHQRAQVKSFYQQHHLSAISRRMRYGAGGWMGLGGMWGGFGW